MWGLKVMALGLGEHGALKERFVGTTFANDSSLDLSGYISARHNLINLTEEGNKRGIQVQMGMGEIEQLGAGLQSANGAVAAIINERRKEDKEKKDREARRLQAYLDSLREEIDALGDEIDALDKRIDNVEDIMQQLQDGSIDAEEAMRDPEVADAISAWEQRTGKKFDPEADNAADVLTAILGAHRDELLTERNALQDHFNDLVDRHNQASGATAQLQPGQHREAREIAEQGYSASATVIDEAPHEDHSDIGFEVYDQFDDSKYRDDVSPADSIDGLASSDVDGLDIDLSEDLELASSGLEGGLDGLEGVVVAHFTVSAQPSTESANQSVEPQPISRLDLGTLPT